MLQIDYDYSLNHHNTMALASTAKTVITLTDETQLTDLPASKDYFILSGGSNVLLPEYLDATVLLPRFLGKRVVQETEKLVVLEVMAGEVWHDLVVECTQKGWYGLENLASIPGLVGAAPIQNIGAYGVSLEEVVLGVKIYRLSTKKSYYVEKAQCQFGYRDSVFKRTKDALITSVFLKLHKNPTKINTQYGDVAQIATNFAKEDGHPISPLYVMEAIIHIRKQKLPDPKELPNCGSFFQNPIIPSTHYRSLKERFEDLPCYPIDDQSVKVPAGWLIDKAGLKGGGVAPILTHKNQALVLTNHAPHLATQKNIKTSQDFITKVVADTFGIELVREPVWVNEDGTTISLSQ